MKFEKEVEILELKIDSCITGENYTTLKVDKLLSNVEFNYIANNFTGKKIKLILEVEKPILNEKEKQYLRRFIDPFRDRVANIVKYKSYDFENKEYIAVHYCNTSNSTMFPYYKKGTMYKGMKLNKEYTLKELGL